MSHDDDLKQDYLSAVDDFKRAELELRERFHKGEMSIRERIQDMKRAANKLAGDLAGLL